jgi:hypothetical protein
MQEDAWWRENFSVRPYAAGQAYDEFQPAYHYGFESARQHSGKGWGEVEESLRTGWDKFEGKRAGGAAWENIKDAVKDAWHRAIGAHGVDSEKMAEFEKQRLAGGVPTGGRNQR